MTIFGGVRKHRPDFRKQSVWFSMPLQTARFNCLSAASGLFFALSVGAVWAQDGSAPSDDVLQATEPVEDVEELVIAEDDLAFLVDLFLADPAVFLETRDGGEIEAVIAQAVSRDPQTITVVLVALGQTTDAGIQSAIANGIASAAARLSQEGRATEVATILASVATQSSTAFLESVTGNLVQLTEQAGVDGSQDEGDASRVEGDNGNADILSPQPDPPTALGGDSGGAGDADIETAYITDALGISGPAAGSAANVSTGQTGISGGGVSSGGAGDPVSPVN